MTWFKVDDSFHSHPKVLATDPAALGLWALAGAWCSANLTDGFVPDHALPRLLPGSETLAKKLVTSGLWRRARGGYRFHDWSDYNPSAESIRRERDAARDRMRALREKRGSKGETAAQPVNGSGEQSPNVRAKFVDPDPTRPDSSKGTISSRSKPEDPPPDPDFDRFWAVYPRREAKAPARRAWDKAINRATTGEIIAGAERYRDLPGREPGFTAHGASWLNADRWTDEPVSRVRGDAQAPPSSAPDRIPIDERCPDHRDQRTGHCRHCRARSLGGAA